MRISIDKDRYFLGTVEVGNVSDGLDIAPPNTGDYLKDMSCKLNNDNNTWVYDETRYQKLVTPEKVPTLEEQVVVLRQENAQLASTVESIMTNVIPNLLA
jgi:hypothetical protein